MPGRRRAAVALTLPGMDVGRKAGPVSPASRALCAKPGRTKREAPAPRPWEAVLLVVDTAKVSGWAIGVSGSLKHHGEHDTEAHPELTTAVVYRVLCLSVRHLLPVVMVLEAPYGGAKHAGQVHVLIALGVAKERWLRAWREAGQAKSRVCTVEPSVWRGPVLGSWAVGLKREQVRASELSMARGIVGRNDVEPDEAAAICIHHWAAHAAKVGEKLGKRAQRASMAAWTRPAGGAR